MSVAKPLLIGTLAPLKHRRYRLLWAGSLAYGLAQLMQTIAAAWTALEITNSPLWVGIVTASPLLPVPFIALFAGALADKMDRRLVLAVATAIMSMISATIALLNISGQLTPGLLSTLMIGVGIGIAFVDPTWQAIIPDVVPASILSRAITLSAGTNSGVWALGSAVAGIMLPVLGTSWVFSVSVAGYVAMFATAVMLGQLPARKSGTFRLGSLIITAFRHARTSRHLPFALRAVVLFGATAISMQALLPSVSTALLGLDERYYGLLVAAFGLGSVIGILSRSNLSDLLKSRTLPAAVMAFGVSALVVSASHSVLTSMAAMMLGGAMWTCVLATLSGAVQMLTPEHIRARIIAFYVVMLLGSMTIGSILAGLTGQLLGPVRALKLWSLAIVSVGVALHRCPLPDIDHIKRQNR